MAGEHRTQALSAEPAPPARGAQARMARPLARLPLLVLGFVSLATGVGAGLARLGVSVPDVAAAAAASHGPLMVGGFFGVVISLERAVAIGRPWAYLAPLLAARTRAGGHIALAGILEAQAAELAAAYAPWFDLRTRAVQEDWALVAGARR